jgi:hypothetical protein
VGWTGENKESPAQKMILYTEKQLREAYKTYIKNLTNSDVPIGNKKILHVPIPTLEEFRNMYEDYYSKFHISNG